MPLSHPTLFTIHAAFTEDTSAVGRHAALTCAEAVTTTPCGLAGSRGSRPVTVILGGWSTLCASRRVRCTEAAG